MTTLSQAETRREQHYSSQSGSGLNQVIAPMLLQFDSILQSYTVFNLIFLTIGFIEFALLLIFFTFLTQSAALSFSLAFVFLTFFSYFILRLYFQAQKPEQLLELKERYTRACKGVLRYQEGIPESYVVLSNAFIKLSESLSKREYDYFQPPQWLTGFKHHLERFSCWCHWHDIHYMRELLLSSAVEENIKLVKNEPTSLDAHASLANAYIMLSGLYLDPRKQENRAQELWIPSDALSEEMEKKFRITAEKAIEEFKIIKEFSPNDPWVHAQLAYSYHDLKMAQEEIKEYEILLSMEPESIDVLIKLGTLYFQQGVNAKGLRIYEQLKKIDTRKAEDLIKHYGG